MADRNREPSRALVFALSLPKLQAVAREHGYALGIHGSMATDFDLIAAPWVPEAGEPETLIEALCAAVGGTLCPRHYCMRGDDETNQHYPTEKPHGRRAWSIYLHEECAGPYLDVSVMPRQ